MSQHEQEVWSQQYWFALDNCGENLHELNIGVSFEEEEVRRVLGEDPRTSAVVDIMMPLITTIQTALALRSYHLVKDTEIPKAMDALGWVDAPWARDPPSIMNTKKLDLLLHLRDPDKPKLSRPPYWRKGCSKWGALKVKTRESVAKFDSATLRCIYARVLKNKEHPDWRLDGDGLVGERLEIGRHSFFIRNPDESEWSGIRRRGFFYILSRGELTVSLQRTKFNDFIVNHGLEGVIPVSTELSHRDGLVFYLNTLMPQ